MIAPALRQTLLAASLLVGLLAGLLPGTALADRVTVFAAASMTTALQEIEELFEAETGHALVVSLAGSSALARQIQQGAPADVFISASSDWMDALEADGLIDAGTRVDLLGNRIVLVAHGAAAALSEIGEIDAGFDLAARLEGGKLAMALIEAVPAGIYGKAALDSLGLWDSVAQDVAQTDNVRAALALVATGEAPYGIVYATDAAAEKDVSILGLFPADSHPPIIYPAARIAGRGDRAAADFMAFLRGPDARRVFEQQGFTILER